VRELENALERALSSAKVTRSDPNAAETCAPLRRVGAAAPAEGDLSVKRAQRHRADADRRASSAPRATHRAPRLLELSEGVLVTRSGIRIGE